MEPTRNNVWKMFNDISPTYDRINRILSFGFDKGWRKKVAKHLPEKDQIKVLDLACGTADQIICLMENSHQIDEIYGVDPAKKMLEIGANKLKDKFYKGQVKFSHGSAEKIPFEDNSFDVVTISFGIRNVEFLSEGFKEIRRVLKPGGRLLVLEFSLPEHPLIKKAHLFYLRKVLPIIGGLLSQKKDSYEYLNKTIETFPYGKSFLTLLKDNGFKNRSAHPLFLGAVSIYVAES